MGIGADLDIWDKLLDCVPSGQEFVPYGDVEDAFFDRYPAEADVLLRKYGHRWRDSAHPAGRFSMSVYLSGRLRELADRGELEVRWEPARGRVGVQREDQPLAAHRSAAPNEGGFVDAPRSPGCHR